MKTRTDTFGQVILEAQASGLPVVAVAEGGPVSLIEDGRSGLLRPADPGALAAAVAAVAGSPGLATRLAEGGRAAVGERTWEASLGRLAEGYATALGLSSSASRRRTGAPAFPRRAA